MSARHRVREQLQPVEGQPARPLPMPEYQYQSAPLTSGGTVVRKNEEKDKRPELDLSGVSWNFS